MDLSQLPFISKSLMKTAKICTERMWKLFVEGIESESSPAATFGNAGHAAWSEGAHVRASLYAPTTLQLVRNARELCSDPPDTTEVHYEWERKAILDGLPLRGRLDRLMIFPDNVVIVDDLKFGKHEDDPFERNLYIWLATGPETPSAEFRYICPTEGMTWVHQYSRSQLDALPDLLLDAIAWLASLPVMAMPGPHCEDMYGIPCQFLGRGCSLDRTAADLVAQKVELSETRKTLQALLDGNPEIISALPSASVAQAYVGLQQLTGITKQVQKNIAAWAKTNGKFVVGETDYGMNTSPVFRTNKSLALRLLLETKDLATILSGIDVSNSTIEKCKDPEVKARIEAQAIKFSHELTKFGVIKKHVTD